MDKNLEFKTWFEAVANQNIRNMVSSEIKAALGLGDIQNEDLVNKIIIRDIKLPKRQLAGMETDSSFKTMVLNRGFFKNNEKVDSIKSVLDDTTTDSSVGELIDNLVNVLQH